ncbi:MAG: hypothetical protein JXQ73_21150 [Phycisphaerae bacterium]|nr:hypothetical protein [Phycisphaerae bacterium]
MTRFERRRVLTAPVCLAFVVLGRSAGAEESEWPREIQAPEAKIVVYQPQLESFKGNTLTARAAVSVTPSGAAEPVFGAVWLKCRVETDRDSRTVTLVSLEIPEAKFPNAEKEKLDKLVAILKSELPKHAHPMSLDRLLTALAAAEKEKAADEGLKTAPPKIVFVKHPAMLVSIDGEPRLGAVEKSKVLRVINTPFLILQAPESKSYYLWSPDRWFTAGEIKGPWHVTAEPPAAISSLVVEDPNLATRPAEVTKEPKGGAVPEVIVATESTELISTDGAPKFSPIAGTGLLYMSNTDSDVFMEIGSQEYIVLLSGRWYRSKSMEGPWSHVPADKLSEDFAKVPEGSTKGHVLAQVAGTDQAEEAVREAYIPQTAKIDRKKATVTVVYDGKPKFKRIKGTDMEYAVNTEYDVIRVGGSYYCCHEAVWFMAGGPDGPWVVCASVPQVIYTISPECPVYPVKYVYVYESTPEFVYVGYTPGYVGCYPFGGVVVYGTGYRYAAWYGTYYYPRPVTWGFGVHYNRVTCSWGCRAGYAGPHGWVAFGYHNGVFYKGGWVAGGAWGHGWWGHADFHHYVYGAHGRVGERTSFAYRQNIYHRSGNVSRNIDHPARHERPVAPGGSRLANDVFADRNGNVYRRTQEGWEQRKSSGWTKSNLGSERWEREHERPAERSEFKRSEPFGDRSFDRSGYSSRWSELDRHDWARERGAYRTNAFHEYRGGGEFRGPTPSFRGGRGGFRGGRR